MGRLPSGCVPRVDQRGLMSLDRDTDLVIRTAPLPSRLGEQRIENGWAGCLLAAFPASPVRGLMSLDKDTDLVFRTAPLPSRLGELRIENGVGRLPSLDGR